MALIRGMAILTAAALLALPHGAHAGDDVWFYAAETGLALDWRQTQRIVERPDLYYETNPLLGSHPNMGAVNRYFATAMLGTAAIYKYGGEYARPALIGITVLEVAVLIHDRQIGLQVLF